MSQQNFAPQHRQERKCLSFDFEIWLETHLLAVSGRDGTFAFAGEHQGCRFIRSFGQRRSLVDEQRHPVVRQGSAGDHKGKVLLWSCLR